jgi:hypothetical protein
VEAPCCRTRRNVGTWHHAVSPNLERPSSSTDAIVTMVGLSSVAAAAFLPAAQICARRVRPSLARAPEESAPAILPAPTSYARARPRWRPSARMSRSPVGS